MDEHSQAGEQQGEGGGLYVDRGPVEEEWVEAAGWPKVIGIISIVWASLGLCCGGIGTFNILSPMIFPGFIQQVFPDGLPPSFSNPPISILISLGTGPIFSIYLGICGGMLIARKKVARPMFLVYGVIAILSAALFSYFNLQWQRDITEWVKQNPDTAFAEQQTSFGGFQTVILVFGVVFAFAWPLFCLIWFGAVKRDASEITRGVEQVV